MRLISFAVLMAFALAAPAAMYKWTDAQGRTQYSDLPPPPGAKGVVEEHRAVRNTIGTAGAPFAVQDAAKRNPVTLWMHDCGDLCNRARDYLAGRGVPHTLRNPSRVDEQDAWKKASGGDNNVPLLVIGTTRAIKGFQESEWGEALDAAGYPRGAPALRPQTIPPATDPVAQGKPAPAAAQPAAQVSTPAATAGR